MCFCCLIFVKSGDYFIIFLKKYAEKFCWLEK